MLGDPLYAVPGGAIGLLIPEVGCIVVAGEITNLGSAIAECTKRSCKKTTSLSYEYKNCSWEPYCPEGTMIRLE